MVRFAFEASNWQTHGMDDSPLFTDAEKESRLEKYALLVKKYSGTLDLSSPEVILHFDKAIERTSAYDNLLNRNSRILDVGSGVGLPAIPIAIRRPDLEFVMCEIRKRRAAFLEHTVSTIKLTNARVYNGDVQQLVETPFDTAIAQAVGRLTRIYGLCRHLLKPSWMILTRKGLALEDELEELRRIVPISNIDQRTLQDGSAVVAIYGGHA
jgi:16S rRNA (guanine527-N7)-methyltransferase